MSSPFTPHLILTKQRHQLIAGLLVCTIITLSFNYLIIPRNTSATTNTTWQGNDLTAGISTDTVIEPTTKTLTLDQLNSQPDEHILQLSKSGLLINEDSSLELFDGYFHTPATLEGMISNGRGTDWTFKEGDFIYVAMGALHVIDTKGTISPTDDEVVARYSNDTDSIPRLANPSTLHAFKEGNILYLSTSNGLHVIDTKGTIYNQNDDELIVRYYQQSNPALVNPTINYTHKEGNILYLSTRAGLHIIDTKGTISPIDDELVGRYHTGSNIPISSNEISKSFVVENVLYIKVLNGPIFVINTKGTGTDLDDELIGQIFNFNEQGFTLEGTYHDRAFKIINNNLYFRTQDNKLGVLALNNPLILTDDVFLAEYSPFTTPNLIGSTIYSIDIFENYLYVTSYDGLTIIDTKGTLEKSDDTLLKHIPGRLYSGLVIENNITYALLADEGIMAYTPQKYYNNTHYRSFSVSTTTPHTLLAANTETPPGTNIALSYHGGGTTAVWRDEFDTTANFAGDLYDNGGAWQSVTATSGVMRLTGEPIDYPSYSSFSLMTGYPDNHFDAGSTITLRYRVLNRPTANMNFTMSSDGFEEYSYSYVTTDDWQTLTIKPEVAFSNITIELYTNDVDEDLDSTILELDYLQIDTADSMGEWDAWQPCADSASCPINQSTLADNDWLQYKLDFATTDHTSTPKVNSITYSDGYTATGTYQSVTKTFSRTQTLDAFNPVASTPASTTIDYEYSLDKGNTWKPIAAGATFPPDTRTDSFTWRATFTTTNPTVTPTLTSVSISSTNYSSPVGTLLTDSRLANSSPFLTSAYAESILRRDYPEFFTDPDAPLARQKAILILLAEVVRLLVTFKEES